MVHVEPYFKSVHMYYRRLYINEKFKETMINLID